MNRSFTHETVKKVKKILLGSLTFLKMSVCYISLFAFVAGNVNRK